MTKAAEVHMWADIPVSWRATDQTIIAGWTGRAPHYRDRERARLAHPGPCMAATRKPYGWIPCGIPTIGGADLCATHGGPKHPRKVAAWVRYAETAWEEGFRAGLAGDDDTPNPYRQEDA